MGHVLASALLLWSGALAAHHSFSSIYDSGQSVSLTGTVDIGMTADTFRPGDRVIIGGSPGRNQPNILYLWRLERPADGLRYQQIGCTPSISGLPSKK